MSWSLRLFRIRGIDIKVHLTFVPILIWATYRWGIAGRGGMTGAAFGVVVTLLLFVCVTLHELAHSFVAMHYGVKVRDITLLPIGGLAQIEKMPEKPSQELKMSLAGPLTNLVIAGLLIAICLPFEFRSTVSINDLYRTLDSISWPGLVAYLVTANLALGLFNLVPAFPMDGGRVLRALLAMRNYDAQQRMSASRLRALPVVSRGNLVGLLTTQDINDAYLLLPAMPHAEVRSG